jgi:fructose-1,6-bisphosphatase II
MSVIAVGNQNSMFCTEEFYMHKLAYGPEIAKKIKLDISVPLEGIVRTVSTALDKPLNKMMVCLLNRPRHDKFIAELRALGVRIKLIQDCDVSGAIATCLPESGIDLLYGIGGAPEAVIATAAVKCLQGDFQAIISDKDGNLDNRVFKSEDLVRGHCAFAATGITDGSMLRGVRINQQCFYAIRKRYSPLAGHTPRQLTHRYGLS